LRSPSRRGLIALIGALAGTLVLLPLSACVLKGTYDEVLAQRDALTNDKNRLEIRVEQMSASVESLDSERARLLDELEDLRIKREELDVAVRRLERSESYLSTNLKARNEELAARKAELGRLRGTYESLVSDLESEVSSGQIEIQRLRDGLRLNVAQDILFASGSTKLNKSGIQVLRKVARQIAKLGHRVEIQGHTDNVPIRASAASRFPTNWELAAARAAVVVRLLASEGVNPSLLSAVSYGEFNPVASNDTPEGRLRNRRIEIRLEPAEARDDVIEETESDDQRDARQATRPGAARPPRKPAPAPAPGATPAP
jgi:chemotaxis protein MotB